MTKCVLPFPKFEEKEGSGGELSRADFALWFENYLHECEYIGHSATTIELKKHISQKFLWFVDQNSIKRIDEWTALRFLKYLSHGTARWGNTTHQSCQRPASPDTIETYHRYLKAFFNWCVEHEYLERSPMARIKRPKNVGKKKIASFTEDEIKKLYAAAKKSRYPLRDTAMIAFLLDTGARVSEMCSILIEDVDWARARIKIIGKGAKPRTLFFGPFTRRLLRDYITSRKAEDSEPLFTPGEGYYTGLHMTRSGVSQAIRRIGKRAGLNRDRISPHTFRHTFALTSHRAGVPELALRDMLGHSTLKQTSIYVAIDDEDLAQAHRAASPADAMLRKRQGDARRFKVKP